MVAQTVPSKVERERLCDNVAAIAGCTAAEAAAIVSLVLYTWGVTEEPPSKRRRRRIRESRNNT